MARLTEPLREEHRELLPHVETLRALGDEAGQLPPGRLRAHADAALEFLQGHLIPHALAEDAALYPVVDEFLGAPGATATMSRDHVEVGRLVAELVTVRARLGEAPVESDLQAVRRLAYGLYALVSVHFAKEEEIYLPLLDAHLSEERAREMFAAMESAAAAARAV